MNTQNYLSVEIKKTDAQLELVRKLGSKNKTESLAAGEAIAAVVAEPILQNILQAPVISNFFKIQGAISETDIPAIPLAQFFDVRQRNFLNVWTQTQAGGLASNKVGAASDLYVDLYNLTSAVNFPKKWARASRVEVIGNVLTKLAQEVLTKRNNNSAYVLMGSLAGARIDGNSANTAASNLQVYRTQTQGVFGLVDLNDMATKYRRITASWEGGTPAGQRYALSDVLGSPEFMGQIRSISYQPQNTRAGSLASNGATALAAPESIRSAVWSAAGITSFFDMDLHDYNELGLYVNGSQAGLYNQYFADAAGSLAFAGYGGSGTATFSPTTEQLVVGLNRSMFDLLGLRRSDEPAQWSLTADDQYALRDDTAGWFGSLTEGYASVDNRGKVGWIF